MSFNYEAVKDLIRCPRSRSELVLDGASLVCVDPACRLRFAIRDDIPCLLEEEARELSTPEWTEVIAGKRRETTPSTPR